MFYNDDRVCELRDVKDKIRASSKFGWSACKELIEPYRHTAVVLYLNSDPCFTINFRPAKGAYKYEAAFSECDSIVTIEHARSSTSGRVIYYEPFEEFSISTKAGKKKALDTVELILSYKPGNYSLVRNNCRDFVEGVKEHVRSHRDELDTVEHDKAMNGVRGEDINRYLGAASLATATLGGLIWAGSAVVSYFAGDSEEKGKEKKDRLQQQ